MNEKTLIENRNAKVTEMETILNLAKAENRVVTDEENVKFENLQKEVKDIDRTIALNDSMKNVSLVKVPEVEKKELSPKDKDRKAFENIIRNIKNDVSTFTTVADGQVTIPTTIASEIIDQVIEICPIFQLADRYNIKGKITLPKYDAENSSLSMTYATEGTDATGGELKLTQIELNGYLGRALALVSKSLVNNSAFDIVGFVEAKMAQAIALFIETELLNPSDPTNKIAGLSGIVESMTVNTASANAVTVDDLMDTQDKVIDKYQGASIWIMNKATRNALRKLKDNEGDYLLNRDLTAKWGYTLLGKDVYCSDAMDEIGTAGNTVIYYGDFSGLAVKVSEDINMEVLREKYAEQHLIGILAFVEMDAQVADTQKISKLVCGNGTKSI